ncbi:MAG TPA: RagB/SusD family nutrient uptake outer membrane protein [Gemmatimonadales bacterium]|nr:RagB/SusD family nutrient uptake outer membrane protein [Gemmatimonadales bacterium]
MKRTFVVSSIGAAGLCALLLVPVQGCTNLDETPPSAITPGNFFHTEGEVLAALAGVYAQLRGTVDDYYNVSEISTDEMVVPTRGQDWYDNGTWLETHRQQFTPTSPATLSFLNGSWNTLYAGVERANGVLDGIAKSGASSIPNGAKMQAEAKFLRAFYFYQLMDLFGGVPLATVSPIGAPDTAIAPRARVTRDSLFKFIESELLAARPDLPLKWDAGNSGRATKGAVDALLANMYINAGVFTKDNGINATAYNSCAGVTVAGGINACQAAANRVDSIRLSNTYQLADTFAKNFRADNASSPENIFVIKFADEAGLGLNFVMRVLHYNQFSPTPWNGFSALGTAYASFDSLDARRQAWTDSTRNGVFLVGRQANVETGKLANDRAGNPLIFTPDIANVTSATEGEGARIYKWSADPKHVNQDNGNDFAWFRLAEMYLIEAEAILDGATTAAPAPNTPLALVQAVRKRDFTVDTLTSVTLPTILRERLFEFIGEGKRRQDLVRFGQYTAPFEFKTTASPDYKVLMPIPQSQIDANPLMTQNTGY